MSRAHALRLWQHLLAGILNKAAVIFGSIFIVTGVLFVANEYRLSQFIPYRRRGTGTVVYNSFEGGFWGIIADDGNTYDIHSGFFPNDCHVDGLRVEFDGYVVPNRGCYHQWGAIFELTDIRRL